MDTEQVDKRSAGTSSLAVIGTITCLGCVFLLIAATIVVSLIPIYTPHKTVTKSSKHRGFRSVQMHIGLDAASGRRKRGLSFFNGATFDSVGLEKVQTTLLANLPSNIVDNVDIDSAVVTTNPYDDGSYPYALNVSFAIVYKSTCSSECQLNNAANIRTALQNAVANGLNLGAVPVLLNGQSTSLAIIFGPIVRLTDIVPDASSNNPTNKNTNTNAAS